MSNGIKLEDIRRLYQEKGSYKAIFDRFAAREKGASVTKVDTLLLYAPKNDIIALFRRLEAYGCGTFIAGRKGHRSRFQWTARPRDVGRAARDQTVGVVAQIHDDEPDEEDLAEGEPSVDEDVFIHPFQLRANRTVQFVLPKDLTTAEAERLATFIRSLPLSA